MATDQGKTLNELEEEIYSWQMDVTGFGLEGQQKLKQATVMISRCGGWVGWLPMNWLQRGSVDWFWRMPETSSPVI